MANMPPSRMPSLGDDPPSYSPPPPQYASPPPTRNTEGKLVNRTALWVIAAMSVGFFLPVCACAFLCFSTGIWFNQFADQLQQNELETGPAIGIIDLSGPILGGDGFGASEGYMRKQIEWMEETSDIKAIVVRANSPGGEVNASDEIWHVLSQVKKPVVVSVQGICASGCLYIASAADEIHATRSSQVGSIGVISYFFNAEELLDNIGIEPEVIATGDSKDFGSFFRDMTAEEEAFWRDQMNVLLDNFIDAVANRPGSNLSVADVRELATGQVWVAEDALKLGLIDDIGYEEDVIKRAADLAGISNYRVQEYPFDFGIFSAFFNSASSLDTKSIFELPTAQDLSNSLQQPAIQYRYFGPYDLPKQD